MHIHIIKGITISCITNFQLYFPTIISVHSQGFGSKWLVMITWNPLTLCSLTQIYNLKYTAALLMLLLSICCFLTTWHIKYLALWASASAASYSCSKILTQMSEIIGIHVNSVLRWISPLRCMNTGASSGARDWCKHCFNHFSAWPIVAFNLSRVSWDRLLGKQKNLLTSFAQIRVRIIFNSVIALTVYHLHC